MPRHFLLCEIVGKGHERAQGLYKCSLISGMLPCLFQEMKIITLLSSVRAWKNILGTWELNEIRCGTRENAKLLAELKVKPGSGIRKNLGPECEDLGPECGIGMTEVRDQERFDGMRYLSVSL